MTRRQDQAERDADEAAAGDRVAGGGVPRRATFKWAALTTAAIGGAGHPVSAAAPDRAPDGAADAASAGTAARGPAPADDWGRLPDRVWLGPGYWANPMEDWRIRDGAAECWRRGGNRSVHRLTHRLTDPAAGFEMTVRIARIDVQGNDSGAGFRVGIAGPLGDYRADCFVGGGFDAGVTPEGLRLGNQTVPLPAGFEAADFRLSLSGRRAGGQVEVVLILGDGDGQEIRQISTRVPPERLRGNVAIVNGYERRTPRDRGGRYAFADWRLAGDGFTVTPGHAFGPILWSMYTLSDSRGDAGHVLKLTALTGPLGEDDEPDVRLEVRRGDAWESLGRAALDRDSWTATFRAERWDATEAVPYRLAYRQRYRDGEAEDFFWSGTIRDEPRDRPLRLGALTCQNAYAFPYQPVVDNLARLDPDMLYFSGDQLYENHGGFGVIRDEPEAAILNYLRKFYMFGWSFGAVMRDRPTVCIPDDHDVFQGNIWGESGKPMTGPDTSSVGGYRQPARMVNVVHRTNVSHHPDPAEPEPVLQDISVYYGDLVYGNVGFVILSDRQFKSGPEHVDSGPGRADHVSDPDFDTSTIDRPELVLLGERQENYLRRWVEDWRGHTIKVILSQTVFAGVATHHGSYDGYLKADLDSGGWPQTARNRAIEILRPAQALHINGDQHLTTLVRYGVDEPRDAFWSFCTPAIAVGYPRWWRPDELQMPHANRPPHGLPDTGDYVDGLGNHVHVYAVGNPEPGTEKHPYQLAHQKGSGFGFVTIDPAARTYRIESFRFSVDAREGDPSHQFPGWPVILDQATQTVRPAGGDV